MKANSLSTSGTNLVVIVLGILAALLVLAVLTGRKAPLLSNDRTALLGLVVIGMAICSQAGIGRVSASGQWVHPLSIVGYMLGGIIILIGIAALVGKQIPPLSSYHQSFIAVVVIAALKVIVATIHRLL